MNKNVLIKEIIEMIKENYTNGEFVKSTEIESVEFIYNSKLLKLYNTKNKFSDRFTFNSNNITEMFHMLINNKHLDLKELIEIASTIIINEIVDSFDEYKEFILQNNSKLEIFDLSFKTSQMEECRNIVTNLLSDFDKSKNNDFLIPSEYFGKFIFDSNDISEDSYLINLLIVIAGYEFLKDECNGRYTLIEAIYQILMDNDISGDFNVDLLHDIFEGLIESYKRDLGIE